MGRSHGHSIGLQGECSNSGQRDFASEHQASGGRRPLSSVALVALKMLVQNRELACIVESRRCRIGSDGDHQS
jgi:hypothetical protein